MAHRNGGIGIGEPVRSEGRYRLRPVGSAWRGRYIGWLNTWAPAIDRMRKEYHHRPRQTRENWSGRPSQWGYHRLLSGPGTTTTFAADKVRYRWWERCGWGDGGAWAVGRRRRQAERTHDQ